eukprot:TRINITY_DN1651_c0_g1_i11.p1 TRINITY_DN1651_c0_g1~~TRINITY_DN1651_c0_g1_i11.p1  ORF type:complete len:446 (+),score=133.46 TRINITY_DN1651_c0_g1_i11:78-1415(+)
MQKLVARTTKFAFQSTQGGFSLRTSFILSKRSFCATVQQIQKQDTNFRDNLTPKKIFEYLDKHIIGQAEAKRAVAIALRNRWRRKQLKDDLQKEVYPKNILMVGPTGSGKTEIARRLSTLLQAPFIKVEATKYTEIGYHGKDVEQMIHDLTGVAVRNAKSNLTKQIEAAAPRLEKIANQNILELMLGSTFAEEDIKKAKLRTLEEGLYDNREILVEVPDVLSNKDNLRSVEHYLAALESFRYEHSRTYERFRCTIKEARETLARVYREQMKHEIDVVKNAVQVVEEEGIVFIDELDKIATPDTVIQYSKSPSTDGVQRDLLPILEGTTVSTKHGDVKTDHILFIGSGAFSQAKPTDLIPELLGRLPIRVELKPLGKEDFKRILLEPEYMGSSFIQRLTTKDLNVIHHSNSSFRPHCKDRRETEYNTSWRGTVSYTHLTLPTIYSV